MQNKNGAFAPFFFIAWQHYFQKAFRRKIELGTQAIICYTVT